MCFKNSKFKECRCGLKGDEEFSYSNCDEVEPNKMGCCSVGLELNEIKIPAECCVCKDKREREERERRGRVSGIGGRHVSFDDDVVVITYN